MLGDLPERLKFILTAPTQRKDYLKDITKNFTKTIGISNLLKNDLRKINDSGLIL